MKHKIRYIGAVLVLALMQAVILPACTGDDNIPTTPDTSEFYEKGEYSLPIVADGRELTLSFLRGDSEEPGKSFNKDKPLVWEKYAEETGINIEWQVIPMGDYQNQSGVRFTDLDDLPDIMCVISPQDGSMLIKLYQDGVMLDMRPYIKDYAPTLQKFLDDNPDVKRGFSLPDGAIVSFGGMNLSKNFSAQTFIRKDWLDKFGLDVPETPDQLYDALYKFVKEDANGNGEADEMGIMGTDYSTARQIGTGWGLTLITGAGWYKEGDEVICQWTSDAYKDFLKWLKKCYDNGILDKDFDRAGDSKPEESRLNANQLGLLARGWTGDMINRNNPESVLKQDHPEAHWVPIIWKDTEYGVRYPKENAAALWRTYGLSTSCKDPIAAVRLFEYIICGPGRDYEVNGLEGINYEVVNGERVNIPDYQLKMQPGTFLANGLLVMYYSDEDFIKTIDTTEFLKEDTALRDEIKGNLEKIKPFVVEPFQPPIPSVEDGERLSDLMNDFFTYREETYAKFIKGELDIDADWDEYVNTMNELGATEMKEIYSK